ncbi:MAG: hypothetical protein ACW963_10410 [Candidatus Sifarchaeia archaeon]
METVNDPKSNVQPTGIARLYMRITGLGFSKHAHVVACDEVETLLQRKGLRLSTATSLTAFA